MLVSYMREGVEDGLDDIQAVDMAIDRCIAEGYLEEYLISKRGEARMMLLHVDEADFEEEREEGRQEGEQTLADSIDRIKAGESVDDLIASGISKRTAELALKYA